MNSKIAFIEMKSCAFCVANILRVARDAVFIKALILFLGVRYVAADIGDGPVAPGLSMTLKEVDILKHYPSTLLPSYQNVILRHAYLVSMDYRTKVASWVAERVTKAGVEGNAGVRSAVGVEGNAGVRSAVGVEGATGASHVGFVEDKDVPEMYRAWFVDYKETLLSRGHMAAAGNHKDSAKNWESTYQLSNVIPQNHVLNKGSWHSLEMLITQYAKDCQAVYVVTGPLWLPKDMTMEELWNFRSDASKKKGIKRKVEYDTIGTINIASPTHFFKVVVVSECKKSECKKSECKKSECKKSVCKKSDERRKFEGRPQVSLVAFIQPNADSPRLDALDDFKVPLEAVESLAGLTFEGLVQYCKSILRNGLLSKKMRETLESHESTDRRTFLESIDLCRNEGCSLARCSNEGCSLARCSNEGCSLARCSNEGCSLARCRNEGNEGCSSVTGRRRSTTPPRRRSSEFLPSDRKSSPYLERVHKRRWRGGTTSGEMPQTKKRRALKR